MSWIKNLVLLVSSLSICYCLLVVGDWFIQREIETAIAEQFGGSEAAQIEKNRVMNEDVPQRENLVSRGYLPMLHPNSLDSKRLVLDYPLIAGLPFTDTYFCNEGYGFISYRSDRFGFRNEDKIWDGDISSIMIGDSFVHGACVPDEETLPQKLSEKINSNVLNLGMRSSGPSHYLTYAYLFIPKLKPKTVYLNFYANDNGIFEKSLIERQYVDNKIEIFSKNDRSLFDTSVFLESGKHAIFEIEKLEKYTPAPEQIDRANIFQRSYRAFKRHSTLPKIRSILQSRDFDQTKNAIIKTLELCEKFNCRLIVSFIPNSEYWRPDIRADSYAEKINQLASELAITFVDGRKILNRKKDSDDFAIKGPHLSPVGYDKMAEAISEIK